jgi:hypothetical protein
MPEEDFHLSDHSRSQTHVGRIGDPSYAIRLWSAPICNARGAGRIGHPSYTIRLWSAPSCNVRVGLWRSLDEMRSN